MFRMRDQREAFTCLIGRFVWHTLLPPNSVVNSNKDEQRRPSPFEWYAVSAGLRSQRSQLPGIDLIFSNRNALHNTHE